MNAKAKDTALAEIEALTEQYSAVRQGLYDRLMDLEIEIARVKRAAMPGLRKAVGEAVALRERLQAELDAVPELFVKPRTVVMHGIRVGYTTTRATVEFDDEEAVIKRIREQLPKDQAELLIRRKESVHKPAIYDLDDDTLKRISVTVKEGEDVVVIKPQDGAVAKVVDAMLESGDQLQEI